MIGPEGYPSNLTPLACKHSISTARLHDNGLEMVTLTKVGSPATHCFGLAAFLASAERMGVYMNTLFAPPLLSPLLGCTSVPGFKCGGKSQISMLWMTGLQLGFGVGLGLGFGLERFSLVRVRVWVRAFQCGFTVVDDRPSKVVRAHICTWPCAFPCVHFRRVRVRVRARLCVRVFGNRKYKKKKIGEVGHVEISTTQLQPSNKPGNSI